MRSIYGMDLMAGDCFQRRNGDPSVYHVRYRSGPGYVAWPACFHTLEGVNQPIYVEAAEELDLLTEDEVSRHQSSPFQTYRLLTEEQRVGVPVLHNWMANGRYSKSYPPIGGPQWVRETNVG